MIRVWSVGGRLVRKDGYTYQYASFVAAKDEIQAEIFARQTIMAQIDVKKINDILLQEIPIQDILIFNEVIDYTFDEKLNWAERDVLKGITEGKPLRNSLAMVLCAVSEDAYNRGRLSAASHDS